MAYVVGRRSGRFEIRESVHTARGPRSRTLAGFDVLDGEVLARAAARAQRPFDADSVLCSAQRAGAPMTAQAPTADRDPASADSAILSTDSTAGLERSASRKASTGRFLAASSRMARSLRRAPSSERMSPGEALIDLLGFADAVRASQPPMPARPLAFPAIGRLVQSRGRPIGAAHG